MLFDSAMESIGRNEQIIKLLKQLNLNPDHPPEDFMGVYQYALVEYGVGKPRSVLEIFRQREIQALFREALEQNNPARLLQQGETFVAEHLSQRHLETQNLDLRREFYEFAAVFIQIAKRTRTPAEILTNQKLESLHRQISGLQERLNRLPTLEGMRTEMARLALPPSHLSQSSHQEDISGSQLNNADLNASPLFALAQQMRGWFETLGYRLESHDVWQNDSFEWILNIPIRRGRYDRILVRGIDGEAGLRDVQILRQAVETHRTDEGWLVTARRISRAARNEVEKEENDGLGCYTLDELIDQDADFSSYLTWLEQEIQRRGIDQKYVPLACLKEEVDPVTRQSLGVSRYAEQDDWIDGYLDLWLDDPAKEHISVLGEFGTGKTWFAFHYAWQALQRYWGAQRRGVERPRLPLVIPLRDYAKAVSVESLFSEFFFRKHEIPIPGYSAFEQLNRMGKLLLIFDGFDEMAARVDRQQMINNFWELAKVVVPGAKVILTCRTEHFPEAKEGRALLNAELQASTKDLTGETPQFEVLELEKFNDAQIRQVLTYQAQAATVEQVMANSQLLDLARRPVLTELILEALPDIEAGKPVDMSRVYFYAVRHKMERDIKAERTFTSMADKLYFLCELSWEMLSTDRMNINYREFPDRIRTLFGAAVEQEKDLDHWHYDMMGQTMLIRNAEGDYAPAHRSLLEFFVAYKFAAELGLLADDFAEIAHLPHFTASVDLAQTFGKAPLAKAVYDLILPMLLPAIQVKTRLLDLVFKTRNQLAHAVNFIGGNAVTLLLKVDALALSRQDLSQTSLLGADFTDAHLHEVNLENADLTQARFAKSFGSIMAVACSPDGQRVAAGDRNGSIRIWDIESQREITILHQAANSDGRTSWIRHLVFTQDGQRIVSARNKVIDIWDANRSQLVKTLEGHTSSIYSLAVSTDGSVIVSGSRFPEMVIRVWDAQTGECLKILAGHSDSVRSVAIADKENVVISGSASDDTSLKIWDLQTGECLRTLAGHTDSVRSLVVHPDQTRFLSGGYDALIKAWDIHSGECLGTLRGHTAAVQTLEIAGNGTVLASGSYDNSVRLWNLATEQCQAVFRGHIDWVESVAISQDGTKLMSGSSDATLKVWNVATGQCMQTFQGSTNRILSIALSPNMRWLASGSDDHSLKLWNLQTYDCAKILRGHQGWVDCVDFHPDGLMLASCSADKTIRIWDINTGRCLQTLVGHQGRVWSVAFSADGQYLISGSRDGTLKLWQPDTGECLRTFVGHEGAVSQAVMSQDNRYLVSCGRDAEIRIWDVASAQCMQCLRGHQHVVYAIALSPDNTTFASAGADNTVKFWDLVTGDCLATLEGHTSGVEALAFYPDGRTLASSGKDNTIRIWNLESFACQAILAGHRSWVLSVAVGQDGHTLVSGSWDETIRIWDIRTGECLKTLNNKPYANTHIKGAKGLTESDTVTLKALGAVDN
ncbi:MAG: NACHT domain-containing protein [Leptolyngbya sp. SIO1D8]|nr:NACHT domain-containing protein [Leptolyngbya sp. SIO1D8]